MENVRLVSLIVSAKTRYRERQEHAEEYLKEMVLSSDMHAIAIIAQDIAATQARIEELEWVESAIEAVSKEFAQTPEIG